MQSQNEVYNYKKRQCVKEQVFSTIIEIVQLESYVIHSKGLILSSNLSPCFTIDICLGPKNHKVFILLNWRALVCVIDEDFVKKQEISLVKKTKLVHIKVIDIYLLSSRDVIHEIIPLDVAI